MYAWFFFYLKTLLLAQNTLDFVEGKFCTNQMWMCVCGVEDVVVNGMFYRFFRQGIYRYHQPLQVPMG